MKQLDDIYIFADIKHLSKRAKQTGEIKNKTYKKWKNKALRTTLKEGPDCDHKWIPSMPFSNSRSYNFRMWLGLKWICVKCRCATTNITEDEMSESLRANYAKKV